jgi:hypothetical protein
MRINYTTYDIRREQDSINPRTRSDVMLLNADEDDVHPYLYARVVGIFHAEVRDIKSSRITFQKMDFLLVRWYQVLEPQSAGFQLKRLYRLSFMEGDDPFAFDFVDPDHILRASHLIPRFALGKTQDLLGPSIARRPAEKDKDWEEYYVNLCVLPLYPLFLTYFKGLQIVTC